MFYIIYLTVSTVCNPANLHILTTQLPWFWNLTISFKYLRLLAAKRIRIKDQHIVWLSLSPRAVYIFGNICYKYLQKSWFFLSPNRKNPTRRLLHIFCQLSCVKGCTRRFLWTTSNLSKTKLKGHGHNFDWDLFFRF